MLIFYDEMTDIENQLMFLVLNIIIVLIISDYIVREFKQDKKKLI